MYQISKDGLNQLTNATGGILGVPEILQGAVQLAAGDWVGGSLNVLQGLALLASFYFIGKPAG